ncbi:MAG TPA: DNA polymerase domain-containing protein [Roseiflexaceae bacterium]|nr:DNA polymerase domain-containing protein [Roseiflexaceae bacterium]HMP41301.1 DNA polymerase domain-containing protein [Roseiflexaceae bacterium]
MNEILAQIEQLQHALETTLGLADDADANAIVSVWADRNGTALVWRRNGTQVHYRRERFQPWIVAAHLDDLPPARHDGSRSGVIVRELAGPPQSRRFLISAASGRALERLLTAGATRRLSRRITGIYELEDDYYRVGPVEQYLIATGRVYFRGMAYDDLWRMQIDLETTALDPQRGRIFLAALRDNHGLMHVIEAGDAADEAALITELCACVRQRDPDVIENHNLFGFDLPFLVARAEALGIPLDLGRAGGPLGLTRISDPPGSYPGARRTVRYSLAGRELIDTLDAVRRHDFVTRDLPSHRLKDVARHFGVAAADRVYLRGDSVYETYRRDPVQVRQYALDDVTEVDALSQRLLGPIFALTAMTPRRYERVAYAGPAMGILEPLLVRATLRAGTALPAAASGGADTPHTGGALHLFATGVATHVVKADIASLYPSLMIHYAIGPACDQIGALLALVRNLTELRLAHKAAARAAAAGSLAAGRHTAMQAAMKLIINSAYGYLGAGHMALFADRTAADEITRRGREVLGHVVAQLRQRGVALIEADTDGVYFAVPPHWDAQHEQRLVTEIAATLPHDIRLEYEGRYAAMLSHEVKNYALLGYDGQLIVRGAALRSSRSEPFGERFLVRALGCLLRGDIGGMRAAYDETLAALRERRLRAADVATSARLTKEPAHYLAGRSRQREGPYEALLAAGRSDWQPGERVRYYTAEGGGYVWLPDEREGEEAAGLDERRDYDVAHYTAALLSSYASRLRKAFTVEDFDQIFRQDAQIGMFDKPLDQIKPLTIIPEA